MNWIVVFLVVLCACPLSSSAEENRSKGFRRGASRPRVRLLAPEIAPSTFPVEVEIFDERDISKVFVSVDGVIAVGRLNPPWEFTLEAGTLPVEVCALADDRSGNSGRDCQIVNAPEFPDCFENATCSARPGHRSHPVSFLQYCQKPEGSCDELGECVKLGPFFCLLNIDPVCGCDGNTYSNSCFASMAGVNVDFEGACNGLPLPFPD